MIRREISDITSKATIRIILVKVKEIKVGTIGIKIERATMFDMGTTTVTTTSTGVTMVIEIIEVVLMFHIKIGKLVLAMVEVVWREFKYVAEDDEKV